MRMRDKILTAACRTPDGIEWTTLKLKQDGNEPVKQDSLPLTLPEDQTDDQFGDLVLPDNISEQIKGDVTVALRSSELLMRILTLPSADPAEISEMIGFQIDKISPFPLDQLAMTHEILSTEEDSSLVLMAAAKRERIDTIGDVFSEKGVRIHSIDARVLGWLKLLKDAGHIATEGCEILIVADGVDFVLAVINDGHPISLRPLETKIDDPTIIDELSYEIGYSLTTLDAEYNLPAPASLHFWNLGEAPAPLNTELMEKCGIKTEFHDLNTLPALSEGLLNRAASVDSHIELIPQEWVDHKNRRELRKKFFIISGYLIAIWLIALLSLFTIYKIRDVELNSVKAAALNISPAARKAEANQQKLKTLQIYTDRSDSSLECLREVTRLLPIGDIEFNSYNYNKGKSVKLRGTANSDDVVYEYFEALNKSKIFTNLKDQSVSSRVSKGIKRTVYIVTLQLQAKEEKK